MSSWCWAKCARSICFGLSYSMVSRGPQARSKNDFLRTTSAVKEKTLSADYAHVAKDSFYIDLPANTDVSSITLFAEEPLSGIYATFRLQGDGSLDGDTSIQTQQRRTSKHGVTVTWYAHSIQEPRPALRATVTISCPYAGSVKLRPGTLFHSSR
jgi:hypothetical protein